MTKFEDLDEQEFLRQFEKCTFPRKEWRHRPHITVAYWYLSQNDLDTAIDKLRDGIIRYNAIAGQGVGYHETATQVWTRIIHAVMKNHGSDESAAFFFERHSYLLDKMLPLLFYSHERFMSKQARESFVPPDLMPLPLPTPVDNSEFDTEPADVPIPHDPLKEIKRTTELLEAHGDDAEAYCRRGQMYLRRREYDLAKADLLKAAERDPAPATALFWLATIQAHQNDRDAAIEYLERSLELGFKWVGFIFKDSGWAELREQEEVVALLRQYDVPM